MKVLACSVLAAAAVKKYPRGYVRQERNQAVEVLEITDEMRASAPDAMDWSAKGATSAVKDQGQCGSCWAFSTVEGIESAVYMATGKMPELSTQQIISCDTTDAGCGGGDIPSALDYVEKAGGLDTASDYPDTSHRSGSTGSCKWDQQEAAKVTAYKYAVKPCTSGSCTNQDEEGLAAALAKFGPISICVNANDLWDAYDGGILSGSCSGSASALDHCVQLVGYDKSAGYWKVRNSWASDWGEDGFIRLPYGKNSCGVADEAVVITASPETTNVVV
eukprot:CAMPEP_0204251480 /NCGR_PEP_ID=MMETSP0468-20130131/273_1 /ASSEMBLY_ACC=CAM_ASM_000383 /TAXON_ID=2969 /ORGANISM="Oxyrrhis marina" /LENGTH=275 /DNA_ID=CAMNT_0051224777 /DNA_START=57 /DNA_END=884 /DNA_ORIENTATION=-